MLEGIDACGLIRFGQLGATARRSTPSLGCKMTSQLRKMFSFGDPVLVSAQAGWRRDALGVIVDGPEPITTVQGEDFFWWVQFTTPEHDLSDDGPYRKAQVLSRYIEKTT